MPPKRIWIPALCTIILGVLIWYMYRQTPNITNHNSVPVGSSSFVENCLGWLDRHQSNDGRWSVGHYQFYCPKKDLKQGSSFGNDIAYTSLGLLCFLGAGYDHKTPCKYKEGIEKAVYWIVSQQGSSGYFADNHVIQALAVVSLCEAYAMTLDANLKKPAQLGLNNLLNRMTVYQSPISNSDNHGWKTDDKIDFSVNTWCIIAMKAAKSGGLDMDNQWEMIKQSYSTSWSEQNLESNSAVKAESSFAAMIDTRDRVYIGNDQSSAVLAFVFLGKRPGDKVLDSLMPELIRSYEFGFNQFTPQQLWFTTLSAFQYGGKYWTVFDKQREVILQFQELSIGTCNYGSVDPSRLSCESRFEATVFSCLTFETYYRRARVMKRP